LNYKVVDLVESYNFDIKVTSIPVETKKYKFLKRDYTPTVVSHGGRRCYSTASLLTPWGHDGMSLPPSPTVPDV
jgi:hypothetical protein